MLSGAIRSKLTTTRTSSQLYHNKRVGIGSVDGGAVRQQSWLRAPLGGSQECHQSELSLENGEHQDFEWRRRECISTLPATRGCVRRELENGGAYGGCRQWRRRGRASWAAPGRLALGWGIVWEDEGTVVGANNCAGRHKPNKAIRRKTFTSHEGCPRGQVHLVAQFKTSKDGDGPFNSSMAPLQRGILTNRLAAVWMLWPPSWRKSNHLAGGNSCVPLSGENSASAMIVGI